MLRAGAGAAALSIPVSSLFLTVLAFGALAMAAGAGEAGEEAGEDPTRRWIVDPLDGTANFVQEWDNYNASPEETDANFVGFVPQLAAFIWHGNKEARVPGAGFGMDPYIRISYATSNELLTEACRRIVRACEALR